MRSIENKLPHHPFGLSDFLCPKSNANFLIGKKKFDRNGLKLNSQSNIEIIQLTRDSKIALSLDELVFLESIDPRHSILAHLNELLALFRQTIFKFFRIRIEFIDHDQCTLFHTDHVQLRLVQTLWGRSTEFVESEYVNYAEIGKGSNELIVQDSKRIQYVPQDHFLLLKGSKWQPGFRGCIHKSPEIEIRHENRLLIVIDMSESPFHCYEANCNV